MHLAFFSSSDFTIPIIESIRNGQNDTLWSVFCLQYEELKAKQKSGKLQNILPVWWMDERFLVLLEDELKKRNLWKTVQESCRLSLIITQPDRQNRNKIIKNPITIYAEEKKIGLFQPDKINREVEKFEELVASLNIDIALLASYGQILSQKVLDTPEYGFLNWHPSLLPKYRGATPMQTALLNGDKITGLSWLNMTREMDAGDIYLQMTVDLKIEDNFYSLAEKMGRLGANTWALSMVAKLLHKLN